MENSSITEKLNDIVSSMQNLVKRVEVMEKKIDRNSNSGQTYQSGFRGRGKFNAQRGGRRPQKQQQRTDLNYILSLLREQTGTITGI